MHHLVDGVAAAVFVHAGRGEHRGAGRSGGGPDVAGDARVGLGRGRELDEGGRQARGRQGLAHVGGVAPDVAACVEGGDVRGVGDVDDVRSVTDEGGVGDDLASAVATDERRETEGRERAGPWAHE
ncbi:MAG: hypothetical protein R3A52_28155 [Polyangiales bacterium]